MPDVFGFVLFLTKVVRTGVAMDARTQGRMVSARGGGGVANRLRVAGGAPLPELVRGRADRRQRRHDAARSRALRQRRYAAPPRGAFRAAPGRRRGWSRTVLGHGHSINSLKNVTRRGETYFETSYSIPNGSERTALHFVRRAFGIRWPLRSLRPRNLVMAHDAGHTSTVTVVVAIA